MPSRPPLTVVEVGPAAEAPVAADGLGRTRYVAFVPDGARWLPGSLARAARLLDAHPRIALIAGRVIVGEEEAVHPHSAAMSISPLGVHVGMPGPAVLGFTACGTIVRTEPFHEVGGFDAVLNDTCEEERVALDLRRQGWELVHVPDVVAHTSSPHEPDVDDGRDGRAAASDLLVALMRLPWPVVVSRAVGAARSKQGRRALGRALRGCPQAYRDRSVVPLPVLAEHRRLG